MKTPPNNNKNQNKTPITDTKIKDLLKKFKKGDYLSNVLK